MGRIELFRVDRRIGWRKKLTLAGDYDIIIVALK
jgi:hypothetical protein